MSRILEFDIERAALEWLSQSGWTTAHGSDLGTDGPADGAPERSAYSKVALASSLRKALARLNPDLPDTALDDALRKLTRPAGSTLYARNRSFHRLLVDGVAVEHRTPDGRIRGDRARVLDFDRPDANDWLAVNQLTVVDGKCMRRLDLVLFVNGLPLGVVELKEPGGNPDATIHTAWRQLQTYKAELPALFAMNEIMGVSDGVEARFGTLTGGWEWFKPWRTIDGDEKAGASASQLQVAVEGLWAPRRLLDMIRDFIVFEDDGGGELAKKMAGYHQYHAVRAAVGQTLRATQMQDEQEVAAVRPVRPVVVPPDPRTRYVTTAPLVPLKAAAGAFGDPRRFPADDFEWARIRPKRPLRRGMFVAQVVGRSMEPAIPDGAWCLFSAPVEGTRQGKTVLVELRDESDPETGERYTVKRYESKKAARSEDGDGWRHARVTLKPRNRRFSPIVLEPQDEGQVHVVAELVEVLDRHALDTGPKPAAPGDRRVGVVWHTQGSGKSLTMAFYAGRIVREPAMANPTLVVLTDRNDLDEQLFATFSRCQDLLRQPPEQAEDRADLRRRLDREAGGVVFTTIQKFFPDQKGDRHPLLSDRRNIVVVADEAHRSQYDFIDGFAAHMRDALPAASFIGFTGTPVERTDRNTRSVFGDHISIYDIQRAVDDGATVPIYYEGRLAKLALDEDERPRIDPQFEEVTEGEEIARAEQLKTRWAQLEAVAGTDKRLELVANDLVRHYEQRCEALKGKAMIVCMSRRICVALHDKIAAKRPAWHGEGDDQGAIKVVMTGSASDPPEWQRHIRSKGQREALAKRFRDPDDPFRIAIVRDMWLTGFDAPALHTMYVDKPMRGHGLMQAIARVNRVFRDKPGGLVVDYLGLANDLKEALTTYTDSGGKGRPTVDQNQAVRALRKHFEICTDLFHGFDRSRWTAGTPAERVALLPAAQEHVLAQENGKDRLFKAVDALSKAFALAVPHDEALRVRDDVGFFQTVRNSLAKRAPGAAQPAAELDHAVRQIIAGAVAPEGVIDIFEAAGLPKPDISILSDDFLAEVRGLPQRNLAVDLLRKLLEGEVRARRRKNVVQGRSFAEMLERTLARYRNRAVETAQVIEELIALAKEMREADRRGEDLGLSEDELAFYDALETNDSAVKVLGDETLRGIARELVTTVRNNTTIDWTIRDSVRARLRLYVKRVLRKHGYPPDKQEAATDTVLEQAEALSAEWLASGTR